MRSVCVFCGSRSGTEPTYEDGARTLGRTLAEQGITLVYGGGRVGLMGVVADAALGADGEVVGVIPKALLEREIAHTGLTDLRVVRSMREAVGVIPKALVAARSRIPGRQICAWSARCTSARR